LVTVVTVIIFIVAYTSGRTSAVVVATLLCCIVPDDIPFIDEIIEIALAVKMIYRKSKGNTSATSVNRPAGGTQKISTFSKNRKC
jgi:hypothetical protein